MAKIYSTLYFIVESHEQPFVDRLDGGHLRIMPRVWIDDRTKMYKEQAIDFIKLTMIVGEALVTAMNRRGIDVARVNYQDMGNVGQFFHLHIFGRAKSARWQKFGTAVVIPDHIGYDDNVKPLTHEDNNAIAMEIERLMQSDRYKEW